VKEPDADVRELGDADELTFGGGEEILEEVAEEGGKGDFAQLVNVERVLCGREVLVDVAHDRNENRENTGLDEI
jgi:hypothetical protein